MRHLARKDHPWRVDPCLTRLEERLDWLQLARCEGVGPVTFAALLERHGRRRGGAEGGPAEPGPDDGGPRRVPDRAALEAEIEDLERPRRADPDPGRARLPAAAARGARRAAGVSVLGDDGPAAPAGRWR